MNKIKVIDLIMGGGKSTFCHDYMFKNSDKKYIYVTPYLQEIKRIIGDKDNRTEFYLNRNFREPVQSGEGKLNDLHRLLNSNYNVATTHALFKKSTTETIDLISSNEYVLMLDEALDVITDIDVSIKDYDMLVNNKLIEIDEEGFITWLDNEYEGKFDEFKNLCKNGVVVQLKKTNKIYFLVWNFSPESFKSFKEVYIFTYLFEASFIKYYFDMHNIEYEKYTIEDNNLVLHKDKKPYNKQEIKKLINIYEGHLNNVGNKTNALSMNWLKNYPALKKSLKNNILNYFKNILNAKAETIIWTTFISSKKALSGKGYTKKFIPCNTRATNEYKDCCNLAYCCNRYMSPDYVDYFYKHSVIVDEDLFALSEIVQWIWRSGIREGNPINIYIPSNRMRNLLIDWLNNENL